MPYNLMTQREGSLPRAFETAELTYPPGRGRQPRVLAVTSVEIKRELLFQSAGTWQRRPRASGRAAARHRRSDSWIEPVLPGSPQREAHDREARSK